jgi:uncharacterized protein YceH (UPF0502 family)
MGQRDQPLVHKISPAPGSRAERYGQLLCPDLHPIDIAPARPRVEASDNSLEHVEMQHRLEALEARVESLEDALQSLQQQLGG